MFLLVFFVYFINYQLSTVNYQLSDEISPSRYIGFAEKVY